MTADALEPPTAETAPGSEQKVALAVARTRALLLAPVLLAIGVFGILPLFIALVYSFLEADTYGGVRWIFSTEAYVQLLFERDIFEDTLTFNTAYLEIFWRSFLIAGYSTAAALAIGFPAAYFMATRPERQRDLWVFLITIPFWTNLLIRTFSMQLIIRDEGVINIVLMNLGLIEKPLAIIYTDFAVALGLIYSYLPFMVLPIYAALERLDFRLVEAGFDLYANRFQVLRRIIVPLAKPGIVAGSILVFIPALGAWITPELLGGGKELMIGNMISLQFGSSRNWPFGSAAALVLMAMVLVALVIYVRNSGKSELGHGG
jgi:spermidine/putrescine transport system permease protein